MQAKKASGFTLIELMIVVAILGILASLAYFNFARYGFRARRADGKEFVSRVAAAQERYYTSFNVYATVITGPSPGLGFTSNVSEKGYYTVATANGATGNTQSYILTATPGGTQANDQCGNLTLDNTGYKTPVPTAMPQNSNGNCW